MSLLLFTPSTRVWRFFRAGGFDQVRLDSGADILALDQLDQKLWVALSCPTRGLEFDSKTLDLIDTDKDGRIRAPEIIAAAKWVGGLLKNPDDLLKCASELPLSAINDATPEGQQLLASARQILVNLGKPDAAAITAEDAADTRRIFAQTSFNGDGIIPADCAESEEIKAIVTDIIACQGAEIDRSTKPGINQAKTDAFFAEAKAFSDWWARGEADPAVLPLGAATTVAAATLHAVRAKIDDYFARCRLAAYDARAAAALNREEKEYLAIAAKDLTIGAAEIAALPLAQVAAGRALPLTEGVNPAWEAALAKLQTDVIKPLLGDRATLSEPEWSGLTARFALFNAWNAAKAGATVEKLGIARIRAILAGPARDTIAALIARDKALEPQANAIAAVEKLARYHRDLYRLLNNYVSFRDFYGRKEKAVFQAGTLYLDQRSCELCVRVEDAARHGAMAHLSYTYLAYCDLVRKATGEKMTIAAAFTAGDSDNLMVGRNGLFYDRQGNDWDATITKIIDNPISIRQAFWAPYKRFVRWVEDQVAKRAAAADAAATQRLVGAASKLEEAAAPGKAPPESKRIDVGVVAALGVALGALSTAFGFFLQWLTGTPLYYIPVYAVVIMLVISFPSMILAAIKLRQRNLGPILDANGWAVNARAKINIPFGGSLTGLAKLPPGAHRDLIDPFAEKKSARYWIALAVVAAVVLWGLWNFGVIERVAPDVIPFKSEWLKKHEAAAKAEKAAVDARIKAQNAEAAATAAKATTAPAASTPAGL